LYILGLQIGLNFVPAMIFGNEIYRRREIEFFCRLKCVKNGWFFDIYIQGSKKVQL